MPRIKKLLAHRMLFVKVQAIVTLCVLPLILGALLYSAKLREDLFDNLDAMAELSLKSAIASSEIVLNTIQDISGQLYTDSDVHQFIYQGVGRDREHLSEIVARTKQLMTSSRYIFSVYLVSTRQSLVYSTSYGYSVLEETPDTAFLDWFGRSSRSIEIIDTHRIPLGLYSGTATDVISIFTKLPVDGALQPAGCLVINVDAQTLYNDLVRRIDNSAGGTFLVLSQKEEIILAQPGIELYQDIQNLIPLSAPLEGENGSLVVDVWGKKHLLAYSTLPGMEWKFLQLYPLDSLEEALAVQTRFIFLICFLLLFFSFFVSLFFSNRTTKPFDELLNLLKKELPPPAKSNMREYSRGLEELLEDSKNMRQQLQEVQPVLQERHLIQLLFFEQSSLEQIDQGLAQYGIALPHEGLLLCVLRLRPDYSITDVDFADREMHSWAALNSALDAFRIQDESCFALKTQTLEAVLLLDGQRWKCREIRERLLSTPAFVNVSVDVDIYACIYDQEITLTEVGQAYLRSQWTLDYYILYNKSGILYYSDIKEGNQLQYAYPYEKENRLSNCIRSCDAGDALQTLNELMDAFYTSEGTAQAETFIALTHLHSGLLRLLHDLSLPMEVIGNWSGMSSIFLNLKSRKAVERLFEERISELIKVLQLRRNGRIEIYYQKILDYIEANYGDSAMSLESVSEEIHISVSYINQILKSHGDKSFNQLLSGVRISHASRLLLETDMKIKDIAQSTGYSSSKYFIHVFKELTGVTPGGYRSSAAKLDKAP